MKKTTNRKRLTIAIVSMLTLVVLVFLLYIITGAITKYTGYSVTEKIMNKEDIFKSCLKEKDITLYLNTNDATITLKKIQVYDYLESVKIFNCQNNNEACLQKQIKGPFPTWIINNNKVESDVSLEQLQTLSGCELE